MESILMIVLDGLAGGLMDILTYTFGHRVPGQKRKELAWANDLPRWISRVVAGVFLGLAAIALLTLSIHVVLWLNR